MMPSIAQQQSAVWRASNPEHVSFPELGDSRLVSETLRRSREGFSRMPDYSWGPGEGSKGSRLGANLGSGFAGAVGLLPMAGANIISSGMSSLSNYFQNKERLAQNMDIYKNELKIAREACLYHPSQFQGINSSVGTMVGRYPQRTPRLEGRSPYGF